MLGICDSAPAFQWESIFWLAIFLFPSGGPGAAGDPAG